jgi:hypothetical protein
MMIVEKVEDIKQAAKSETRTGGETKLEKWVEMYLGNAIHLFLSLLALFIFIAAIIATVDTVIRDFPQLWQPVNEYIVLQKLVESILLIAIALELALLLIFHRTTAVVEVMIFVIARKMVSPDTTIVGLLIGTGAVIGLIIVRFYFLPGRVK